MLDGVNDNKLYQAEQLLHSGASPNAREVGSGHPAIVVAARFPQGGFVEELLQAGADPRLLLSGESKRVLDEANRAGLGSNSLDGVIHESSRTRHLPRRPTVYLLDYLHWLALAGMALSAFRRFRGQTRRESSDPAPKPA